MASLEGEDEVSSHRWCGSLVGKAREWIPVFCIVTLAAALRTFALGEIPSGLYHDEAFNGLDALKVLAGQWPIYFAANHGREPLFIYLIAVTVGLLGRTPGALRLAAAICGTLTIPATYLVARSWFDQRVGLLSAAILATTLWHIHLSRIGFRAVTLPLVTAIALWLGARAYRSRRSRDWLLAGLVYGLCFYAYLPARLTPIALAVFAAYLVATGRRARLWPGMAWFAAGTLLTLTPLAIYALGHWDVVMGRLGNVWTFNPLVSEGDPWGTLGRQLFGTLGMFFVRGDTIARHNLPGRPVFDLLMGIAMIGGLARSVWPLRATQARRKPAYSFALIWIALMLVPTWLSEDAPHFLRAAGALPLVAVFPALGLDAAMSWLERQGQSRWAVTATCAVLIGSLTLTVRDYFVRYASDPQTAYAFESAATQLAAEVNRFTGVGWDGSGLAAGPRPPEIDRQVYLDSRLWKEWEAIHFLVHETDRLTLVPADVTPSQSRQTLLLVWPYDGLEQYQTLLPRNAIIDAYGGPLAQGDLEEMPYEAFVAFAATPRANEPTPHVGRFGEQIALVGCTVEVSKHSWQVQLKWEALSSPTQDYVVFVHLRDGGEVIAQHDSEPATGHYPTSLWRSGDIVIDSHVLELSKNQEGESQIVVGMYTWPDMERLEVTPAAGGSTSDELVVRCQTDNR